MKTLIVAALFTLSLNAFAARAAQNAPSEQGKQYACSQIGELAKLFAEQRDKGMPEHRLMAFIKQSKMDPHIRGINVSLARLVYSGLATSSPALVEQVVVNNCMSK